uniref:WAP domain-containing protein n=1 Tax=Globodera rostochiensis TaxID=31243 RepID=A0A914GQ84_GLORO
MDRWILTSSPVNRLFMGLTNSSLFPDPAFFVGLLIICICCPGGASAVCVTKEDLSLNHSSQPLELGGCVNFRCPDNYECNSAYKCCLSAALSYENKTNLTDSQVFGQPFLTLNNGNLNLTKATNGLKDTVDGFKNFIRVIFSL